MKTLLGWTYSSLTALLILAISVIGLRSPRPMIDVRSTPLITHAGGLTPNSPPGQLFRCTQAGLHRIDVLLIAVGPARHARVRMRLRDQSTAGLILREATITPGTHQTGPAWARFEFEPLPDSSNRTYHLSIEPANEAATSLSTWVRYHGQVGENDPWGDRFLEAGITHRGEFVSDHAHLRALAFPVETMFPVLGSARLNLYTSPDSKDPIRTTTPHPSDEISAGWAFFAFEPIPDSRWKRYHYELQAPEHCRLIGTEDENRASVPVYKTFHGLDDPTSPLLAMTRGTRQHSDRDLILRIWADDPPAAVFTRLQHRTDGKLWLAALLWIASTAICLRIFVFPRECERTVSDTNQSVSPALRAVGAQRR